ncbi:MAG: hypothetical protein PWP41_1968 [Moorella sp. (in: firmicutes)]|uniref:Uncharacterized protein n=1 Tax=Neomoorella thermoacetica TaxID=1525 RepID=A0A1J5NQV5_NEOTH|nr:hypothetical protein [Moorella sp. (in: firmicutes)]OIQ61154.1 hypothetical protein MOTE_02290 [Moorella thermoacetica]
MYQVRFAFFARQRRGRCDCCDRHQVLERKILLLEDDDLIGDLILCSECALALEALVSGARETATREWVFAGGPSRSGDSPGE